MADPIKILANEVTVSNTASNNISTASLVRLVNLDGVNSAIIQLSSNTGTVKGTFTLGAHGSNFSCEYLVKLPTDTITISGPIATPVRATSVAYS